jgi:hypothetical protein
MNSSNPVRGNFVAFAAAVTLFCAPAHAGFSATGSIGNLGFSAVDLITGEATGSGYSFVDTTGNYPGYFVDVAPSIAGAWGVNFEQGAGAPPAGGASFLTDGFIARTGIANASSSVTTTSIALTVQASGNGDDGLRVAGVLAHVGSLYPGVVVSLAPHMALTIGFDLSMQLHQDGLCNAGECDAAFALVQFSVATTPGSNGWLDGGYATLVGPGGGGISASARVTEPYSSFNASDLTDYSSSEHHEFVLTNPFDAAASYNLYGTVAASGLAAVSVPEPAAWMLWAGGLPLLALRHLRRRG